MSLEADAPLMDYLRTIDTPTVSNAIERLKIRPQGSGFAPVDIRYLFPEFGPMCAHAVTAQVETVTESHRKTEEAFVALFEAVERSPKPAVVVVQELGHYSQCAAHCGEVMATIFKRLGAEGLVSDCAVRDIAEVRKLGFRYFARGAVASHASFRIVSVNVPVQILGFVVQPQDILHGDENGLIQVPRESFGGLKEAIEMVRSTERRLMEFVRSPNFTANQLRGRFLE
ncbi:MAG TPA: RraA family protein [Terriglobia bacterium]|nr:RraA family protein [Terriglobia bacterium]